MGLRIVPLASKITEMNNWYEIGGKGPDKNDFGHIFR
jgi:hypothetical protein